MRHVVLGLGLSSKKAQGMSKCFRAAMIADSPLMKEAVPQSKAGRDCSCTFFGLRLGGWGFGVHGSAARVAGF